MGEGGSSADVRSTKQASGEVHRRDRMQSQSSTNSERKVCMRKKGGAGHGRRGGGPLMI